MKKLIVLIVFVFFTTCSSADTIELKNGNIIEGTIGEQTDDFIKVDSSGVTITYFLDEIKSVNGEELVPILVDVVHEEEILDSDVKYYELAIGEYTQLSDIDKETIRNVSISSDLVITTEIEQILTNNSDALNNFNLATKLENNGDLFGKEPENPGFNDPMPKLFNHIGLITLNTIQAYKYYKDDKYDESYVNLSSNFRFLEQMGKQEHYGMLCLAISKISFGIFEDFSTLAINNNPSTLGLVELKNTLKQLKKHRVKLSKLLVKELKNNIFSVSGLLESSMKSGMREQDITGIGSWFLDKDWDKVNDKLNESFLILAQYVKKSSDENDPTLYEQYVIELREELLNKFKPYLKSEILSLDSLSEVLKRVPKEKEVYLELLYSGIFY